MSEEGRVGVLMCAGCAFVCLLLFVTVSLTQVSMQDRRLVSCADALAGAGVGGASASSVIARQESGIDEAGGRSRGGGSVRARPRGYALPPGLVGGGVPELERTSSARVRPL